MVVDIYNFSSNTWVIALLLQICSYLAATTIENLTFFADGISVVSKS
jgi:hypothetical protein